MKWQQCSNRPSLPENAQSIKCWGVYCAVICSEGFQSENIWRIKCKSNKNWSYKTFSPCITCNDIDFFDQKILLKTVFRRNLPLAKIRCSSSTDKLLIANLAFKNNRKTAQLRCSCTKNNAQNSNHLVDRPTKSGSRKICQWKFNRRAIHVTILKSIQCDSFDMNIFSLNSTYSGHNLCKSFLL